ncbi:MAG: hypothetical protein ACI3Z7_07520 [Candidatus Aphodosoma sp.]
MYHQQTFRYIAGNLYYVVPQQGFFIMEKMDMADTKYSTMST